MQTPQKHDTIFILKRILPALVLSRLIIFGLAWLSPMIVSGGPFKSGLRPFPLNLACWDTGWFVRIAEEGYASGTVGFFPLYPMLIRIGGWLVGNIETAGFIISNIALVGVCVALWKLITNVIKNEQAAEIADIAVALFLFGSVNFFYSIVYTESAFLLFALMCINNARGNRWWRAGLFGLLAALTRNVGIFLIVPMLIEYFSISLCRPFFKKDTSVLKAIPCLLPALGIFLWCMYHWARFGDPLLFFKAQSAWGRVLSWPWVPFTNTQLDRWDLFYKYWFIGHVIAAVGIFVYSCIKRIPLSLVIFAAMCILFNCSAQHLEAIPRLLSAIFPLYIGGAILLHRHRRWEIPAIACSAGLLALSVILFSNGYWFT